MNCKYCGEHKPGRMRYQQCLDCYNERRRTRYGQDPQYRLRRQQERDVGLDPEKRNKRQARYRLREKNVLEIPVRVFPQKEIQPVKLPAFFWQLMGNHVVSPPQAFNSFDAPAPLQLTKWENLVAGNYLTNTSQCISLRRYRGKTYPNVPAFLGQARYGHFHTMTFREPDTGVLRHINLHEEPFYEGDCIVIQSRDVFRVPPFVRLLTRLHHETLFGMDLSEEPMLMEPGDHGSVRLVLHFEEPVYMIPAAPMMSVQAHLGKAPLMSMSPGTVVGYRKAK